MKTLFATSRSIRNIGVMAHVDAGKTTLTERILFAAGRLHKMGEVHDGAAEMDWRGLEKKHGITISAAATFCSWGGCEITIIDTPGHVDFTIEVERSLRILDSAIALFSAVSRVQPQSETVWRQADRFGAPRLCFVNKMDQLGADFWRTRGRKSATALDGNPLAVQIPIGVEAGFHGVIDLVTMTALLWETENAPPAVTPIPEGLRAEADARRSRMIEALAETDDEALALYLEEDDHAFDETRLKALIRKACVARKAVAGPVRLRLSKRRRAAAPRRCGQLLPLADGSSAGRGDQPGHGRRRNPRGVGDGAARRPWSRRCR